MKISTSLIFVSYYVGYFNLFDFYYKFKQLITHDM
jgi:hypothetical protein